MATMPKEVLDAFTERSMKCTEALSGIPDAWLPDVKKAAVAWKLVEWTKEMDIYEPFQNMQEPLDIALDFRKHGHDFGPELNALIDSLEE